MLRKFSLPSSTSKNILKPHVNTTLALMNIMQFFKKISRRLRGEPEITEDLVVDLMRRLQNTHEEELTCDEVFELIDEYAEASHRGEDVQSLKPLLRRHLDLCRECDEEYKALLQVLEATATE